MTPHAAHPHSNPLARLRNCADLTFCTTAGPGAWTF